MNFKTMETPRNRREFERNFHIAAEQFHNNKVHFSSKVKRAIDGLRKVKMLPNNRIDFLSVDEAARLHVNMMANFSRSKF